MENNNNKVFVNMAKGSDEYHTPRKAVELILPFIPDGSTVWCPFDSNNSEFVKVIRERRINVIYSHIDEGKDFFQYEPSHWDLIISNPPFSLKDQVLKRCYELGKPFALLLPTHALSSHKRFDLFKKHGLELLIPRDRIHFISQKMQKDPSVKTSAQFNSNYFCWNLLPKKLIFE